MCGITGIYAYNMIGRISMINVNKATEALAQRGPDFQKVYTDQTVGLGHRRLSIIDPSPEGHQPMQDNTGRFIIIFNGEIFNYLELKKDLEKKGIQFKSDSDTEVLLYLLINEGISCLQKLNGFFSFAFYDKEERSMLIARDRIGIKPLYYLQDDNRVLFGSEMKAIFEYGIDKKIDFTALKTYFHLNYIPAPKTIIEGVQKLLPGEYLTIKPGTFNKDTYYKIPYTKNKYTSLSYDKQKQKLAELMEESVKKRLISDVPLGSFLSGGIDSSVIATLAKKHKPDLHTFSIGYKDEKFFDETKYAEAVSKKIGSDHTVFSLSNKDLFDHVENILNYFDEPFADSSAIAVYILSKETKQHSTVALSGDGADELFSGYNKHAAFLKTLQSNSTNNLIKNMSPLWSALPKSRNNKITNTFRQLHKFSEGLKLNNKERYWNWAGFTHKNELNRLFNEETNAKIDSTAYHNFKTQLISSIPLADMDINDMLYTDVNLVLTDDMLTKVDRMSMANGLEVRVPFLDHEVVEFAFSLPSDSKINNDIRKRIVQDTFRDILPNELYNRPKKGFEVPLLKWLKNEMHDIIANDLLSQSFIEDQNIFNYATIKALIKKLNSSDPGDAHAKIWALVVFQWWYRKYFIS